MFVSSCKSTENTQAPDLPETPAILLQGRIDLAPEVKEKADPLSVLFIIARDPAGPIAAVQKRLPPFNFPITFTLTEKDIMLRGREVPRQLKLTVRLDKDGNANPTGPGDILGHPNKNPIPRGTKGIEVLLNQEVK